MRSSAILCAVVLALIPLDRARASETGPYFEPPLTVEVSQTPESDGIPESASISAFFTIDWPHLSADFVLSREFDSDELGLQATVPVTLTGPGISSSFDVDLELTYNGSGSFPEGEANLSFGGSATAGTTDDHADPLTFVGDGVLTFQFNWNPAVLIRSTTPGFGFHPDTMIQLLDATVTGGAGVDLTYPMPDPTSFHWDNPAGGTFTTSANWEENAVPQDRDHTVFFSIDSGANYTVDFDANIENGQANVTAGNVTFDLNGHTYFLQDGIDAGLVVNDAAQLTLFGGGTVDATKARVFGGGSLTVDGQGTGSAPTALEAGDLRVAGSGFAGMDIINGASTTALETRVESNDSGASILTISGEGSEMASGSLYVGPVNALLTVEDGGELFGGAVQLEGAASIRGARMLGTSLSIRYGATTPGDTVPPVLDITSGRLGFEGGPMTIDGQSNPADPTVVLSAATVNADSITIGSIAPAVVLANDGTNNIGASGSFRLDAGTFEASSDLFLTVGGNLEIGRAGNARLAITGPAGVTVAGQTIIDGPQDDEDGISLVLDGDPIVWVSGPLTIGELDTLRLAGGAFADFSGATVDGALSVVGGSVLEVSGGLLVGPSALLGGKLTVDSANIILSGTDGVKVSPDSVVSIDNGGKIEAPTAPLEVGGGLVTLLTGRGVFESVTVQAPAGAAEPARVVMNDFSSLKAASSVIVGSEGPGTIVMADSHLDADGGVVVVSAEGSILGTGLISGTVGGPGYVSPGLSPGRLTIDGDFNQESGGVLEIEITGFTAETSYDLLEVTGDATLDGTVIFQFLNGFAPQQGQTFEFLTVGGLADLTGATFETQNLLPGFEFDITPSTNGIVMTALNDGQFVPEPGVPGDFNGDSTVDAADYVVWRKTDGTPQGYADWRANFGRTTSGGTFSPTTAPEPASLVMLLGGAVTTLSRRRR